MLLRFQSGVSRHIRELEDELASKYLFDEGETTFKLNEAKNYWSAERILPTNCLQ